MVQDQLVEYISSQIKLGISRDAIKSALAGVGWAPLDVEDTLKKAEGGTAPAPLQPVVSQKTVEPAAGTAASPKFVSFSTPGTAASQAKNPEPQTIRVSDLVSSVAPASSMFAQAAPKVISSVGVVGTGKATPVAKDQASKGPPTGSFTASIAPMGQKERKIGLLGIVAIVLIVLLGAFAGYLFFKNGSLDNQLQALSGQNQGVVQGSLAQIQALNASNTALAAQIASLTSANQDLAKNLSFFVAPAGSAATSSPILVSGILSAGLGKNTYIVTTVYGAKTYVKNSSDTAVAATLQSLLGATVQLSGTYVPGTSNITVISVNGSPISLPPVPTAPTASTTIQ
jgi:cell division protein FtsB